MKKIVFYTMLLALYPLPLIAQAPDTLWTKLYGITGDDYGTSVLETYDGGFLISANTDSPSDFWIIRTDSLGDTLWTRMYGGYHEDWALDVETTADSCFVIVGGTMSYGAGGVDIWLVKIDSIGDTLWTRCYGDSTFNLAKSIHRTTDNGFIIVGSTGTLDPGGDIYLLKIDAFGDTIWSRMHDGGGQMDEGYDGKQCSDGGYVVTGYTDIGSNSYITLLRTDTNGDTIWHANYGPGHGYAVSETADSGFILTGNMLGSLCLLRFNQYGDTLWTRVWGNSGRGHDVLQTFDGEYIVTGREPVGGIQNVLILRTDEQGYETWSRTYGGNELDQGESIIRTLDGGYVIVGMIQSFGPGSSNVWLLKMSTDPGIDEYSTLTLEENCLSTIFSGPLLLPEDKNCRVFDITGRTVSPDKIKPGIYFVEIDGVITQKVVKIR